MGNIACAVAHRRVTPLDIVYTAIGVASGRSCQEKVVKDGVRVKESMALAEQTDEFYWS
jgi:hypothetical protein